MKFQPSVDFIPRVERRILSCNRISYPTEMRVLHYQHFMLILSVNFHRAALRAQDIKAIAGLNHPSIRTRW